MRRVIGLVPMYFQVEHLFEAPLEVVEAAMFHPDYPAFLRANHEVLTGISPQSREDDGARLHRRIHFAPLPAFEHIGPKKVPAHWFEFIEESVWDKHQRKLVFDHVPIAEQVRSRLSTHGESVLERMPDGRTRRRTSAHIQLKNLPFMLRPFSPVAEQLLSREAKRMIDGEARVFSEWLRLQRLQVQA
jgi:hypothetical protein